MIRELRRVSKPGLRVYRGRDDIPRIMNGLGVAILSPPMWQPAIDAGLLVQPLAHHTHYRNSFWLMYPETKRNLPKIRVFRDWLLAEIAAAAGDDPLGAFVPPEAA